MIAKASPEPEADAGSLESLSLPELLELVHEQMDATDASLAELSRRLHALAERDPEVRTEEELGLTEPYPDLGNRTGL